MSILQKILAQKKEEIAALNPVALRRAAELSPHPRDFLAALKSRRFGLRPSLIAELKRASPSKGLLAPDIDLINVAEIYQQNGAAAISILTDEKFFMGQLETLLELRFLQDNPLPLLRKDFIIDESQIYQARANGADAILLIVAALPDDQHLINLHACAQSIGLSVLVEVHSQAEAERALKINSLQLIGINNRNLATFEVSLATTEAIRPLISPEILVVAESGIFNAADVARLSAAKADAILVGEALIVSADIAQKTRELADFN